MTPLTAAEKASARGTYFFLSYAHSAPAPSARTDTDVWVGQLFTDLSEEVARQAQPASGMRIGFFDQHIPQGADWKTALAGALGSAEVFVPLYSPGYFNRPWAMREQESFRARLAAAGAVRSAAHLLPVLWIPFPSWESRPELDAALDLGQDVPGYAENGLRALCMLAPYRAEYLAVLRRLAQRIVDATERQPLGPSRVPGLEEVTREPATDPAFVVAVLAPTRHGLPEGRDAAGYGTLSRLWRPFGDRQELPVAEYAASTAERLGLPARTTDFADAEELLDSRPVVVLVDPWVTELPNGATDLAAAARAFPPWVVPVVVTDADDPRDGPRGADLARRALTLLQDAGVPRVRWVGRVAEFTDLMPTLVTEARRQYLKNGPVFPPAGPSRPPSLRTTVPHRFEPTEKTDEQ
ncbi:TIR domain-containing protein [Micromonospora sp. U56]|uniref:TIR-like protein FxsC n=1 Tax=Micromonospora sp. U56 TaxID=2824900 RepID=UPI001B36FFE2|nr:TIR-like protein FxsC [Micromonospora sp. U56]MBQ0897072.1 TIR domain-containing protein [Micromonospora sp. U56]